MDMHVCKILLHNVFECFHLLPSCQYSDAESARPGQPSVDTHGSLPPCTRARQARALDGRLQVPCNLQAAALGNKSIVN